MGRRRPADDENSLSNPLATNDTERENQLIYLAEQEAERQLRDHTASPSVICHYLKLKSDREKNALELERMANENENLKVKTQSIRNAEAQTKLYEEALNALKIYNGTSSSADVVANDEDI